MVALVEPTLDGQLAWNRRTIDYARRASDPKARAWEAAAWNNSGDALRSAGRLDDSLSAFRAAQLAYETAGRADNVRFARWQVANVLRLQGQLDAALAQQQALEREAAAAGEPDADVFEELALLHAARGNGEQAQHYRRLSAAAAGKP
jgi:tetratricopeptide (TPR) repeat protein